jgi:hypothetical protein
MSSRPALLDSVIRFLVWTAVIGALATPVLLVAMVNSRIIVSFPFLHDGDSGFVQTVRKLTGPPSSSGIVTADAAERRKQIERLQLMTARAEMTAGAAARLTILAVTFDDQKPEPTPPGSKPNGHIVDPDGYRRLTLNLADLPKDAIVMIADQPIRWAVNGASGTWGRVGFEGLASFDIVEGRPNLIAGFRIRAFGARAGARAVDPGRLDHAALREWCSAIKLWTGHFAVTASQVEFAVLANPTKVSGRNGTVASDGSWGVVRTGAGIAELCKR